MDSMTYTAALAFLDRYTNYERAMRYPYDGWAMNMERVRVLLAEAGHPEAGLSIVHIAGTKGKGSTAAMLEAMLRAGGFHTGLYTSPHLIDLRERIRIAGELVSPEAIAGAMPALVKAAEKVGQRPDLGELTYFEMLTSLALSCFADAECNVVILEAGLGGRYDATNVCDPLLAVITPISYDHIDILGHTLAEIAREKAMIIKPGKKAVIAPQEEEALAVLMQRCKDVRVEPLMVRERYSWRMKSEDAGGMDFDLKGRRIILELHVPLPGEHQMINAATAVTALDAIAPLGFAVRDDAVRRGLSRVRWPARFERIRKNPDVILDGAHNAASARYLRETLQKIYPGRKIIAVIGLGQDKDVEGFFKELASALSRIVLTRSRAVKAVDWERMAGALAYFSGKVLETDSVGQALSAALQDMREDDVLLVTGSFYVIGEAMEWLGR